RATQLLISAALLGIASCENSLTPGTPSVGNLSISENPRNALSVIVAAPVANADSVRVLYWESGGIVSMTPFYPASRAETGIAVLGLHPATGYAFALEARGAQGRGLSESTVGYSGDLPAPLRRLAMRVTGTATSGYDLFAIWSLGYAVAFDSTGTIVWYRGFPLANGQRVDDAELQPNGHYTSYVGTTSGWQADSGAFVEYAPDGSLVRTWSTATPSYTDEHEILLSDDGSRAHFFTYTIRLLDLSSYGGPPDAVVAGHSLVRVRADGTTEFSWDAWDRIPMDAWAPSGNGADFDHPNSLAQDADGNYLVSVRNLNQVRKIDGATGQTLWTVGQNGDFTFVKDPESGFSLQHSARLLSNNHLILYDNGANRAQQETRVVEYALDFQNHTATMVWEYRHSPAIYTAIMGYVQRLLNGNTFVSFSQAGVLNEVSPAGQRLWEGAVRLDGTIVSTQFYRARRIASLY